MLIKALEIFCSFFNRIHHYVSIALFIGAEYLYTYSHPLPSFLQALAKAPIFYVFPHSTSPRDAYPTIQSVPVAADVATAGKRRSALRICGMQ